MAENHSTEDEPLVEADEGESESLLDIALGLDDDERREWLATLGTTRVFDLYAETVGQVQAWRDGIVPMLMSLIGSYLDTLEPILDDVTEWAKGRQDELQEAINDGIADMAWAAHTDGEVGETMKDDKENDIS